MCFIFLYNFYSKHFLPPKCSASCTCKIRASTCVHLQADIQRRLSISAGKFARFFQAEIYAVLARAYEIQTNVIPGKYTSICSDSQVALKALQASETSPLVRQCQKVLNDISTWAHCGAVWVPGHAGIQGNDIANKITRDGSVQKFVGPQLSLGVSRQNIRRKIIHWLDNQHLARWRGLSSTQTGLRIERTEFCPLIGHNPVCYWPSYWT